MFFYIFTCFFIFFFLMKFLGALPQAPSAVCDYLISCECFSTTNSPNVANCFLWASPTNEILLISPNAERPPFVFLRCRPTALKRQKIRFISSIRC